MKYTAIVPACFSIVYVTMLGCALPPDGATMVVVPRADEITEMQVTIRDVSERAGDYVILHNDRERVLELITPSDRYTGEVSDNHFPIVCTIHITTTNAKNTYYIRTMGDNPLIISSDDKAYYWAKAPVPSGDSAFMLVAYVAKVGKKK